MTASRDGSHARVFTDGQAQIVPGFQDPAQWIHQSLETRPSSIRTATEARSHVHGRDASEADGHRRLKVPVI
jgi:hypothetical protein